MVNCNFAKVETRVRFPITAPYWSIQFKKGICEYSFKHSTITNKERVVVRITTGRKLSQQPRHASVAYISIKHRTVNRRKRGA